MSSILTISVLSIFVVFLLVDNGSKSSFLFANCAQIDPTCIDELETFDQNAAIIQVANAFNQTALETEPDCTITDDNVLQCSYDYSGAQSVMDYKQVCDNVGGTFISIHQMMTCLNETAGDLSMDIKGVPYCIGKSCQPDDVEELAQTLVQQDLETCEVDIQVHYDDNDNNDGNDDDDSSAWGNLANCISTTFVFILGTFLLF